MNMTRPGHPPRPWILAAWIAGIASGALATSVIRVPVGVPGSTVLTVHVVIGIALGVAAFAPLIGRRKSSAFWPGALIVATLVSGWLSRRTFAPRDAALHAVIAAVASLGVAFSRSRARPPGSAVHTPGRRRWQTRAVRVAFVLTLVQVAVGALLRHHLAGVAPHLAVGGLAALSILVPAVALTYDPSATALELRAGRMAIGALLVQVALGLILLLMMLTESSAAGAWLSATVTHVVTGTLTLLAVGQLVSVLQTTPPGDDRTRH